MSDVEEATAAVSVDRRRHVRVQDAVGLHVQRLVDVPAAGLASGTARKPTVRKHDKYSIEGYAEVRGQYPAVAGYIGELEERIRELLLHGDEPSAKPTHKISLSAGGVHFADKILLQPGEQISLTLTLFPNGRRIGTDAVIVSANDADSVSIKDKPNYRAEFLRISDFDRRVLENHVDQLLTKRTLLKD